MKTSNCEKVKRDLEGLTKFTAITTRDLSSRLGICPQDIRGAVNELRIKGFPICVGPNGYYWETKRAEVLRYADRLALKAKGIMLAVNGLKKVNKLKK